jgi:hypothetical protein
MKAINMLVTGRIEVWCDACNTELTITTSETESSLGDWHTMLVVKGHLCPALLPEVPKQEASND